jgi:hypothetical protein
MEQNKNNVGVLRSIRDISKILNDISLKSEIENCVINFSEEERKIFNFYFLEKRSVEKITIELTSTKRIIELTLRNILLHFRHHFNPHYYDEARQIHNSIFSKHINY